jgi:hypothetical protein
VITLQSENYGKYHIEKFIKNFAEKFDIAPKIGYIILRDRMKTISLTLLFD